MLALVAGVGVGAFVVIGRRAPIPLRPRSGRPGNRRAAARLRRSRSPIGWPSGIASRAGSSSSPRSSSQPKVSGADGDLPVSTIAIRPDTSTGKKEEDEIDIIPTTSSLQYILCGLGQNCSIKGGTASEERHALLRREALELALYTFKYVDGVDSVSVFLPRGRTVRRRAPRSS